MDTYACSTNKNVAIINCFDGLCSFGELFFSPLFTACRVVNVNKHIWKKNMFFFVWTKTNCFNFETRMTPHLIDKIASDDIWSSFSSDINGYHCFFKCIQQMWINFRLFTSFKCTGKCCHVTLFRTHSSIAVFIFPLIVFCIVYSALYLF